MIMQTKLNRKFNPHIVWNGEMKKLAFSFVLVAAAAILLENIWMTARINSLRRENNTFVAIVMGNMAALYPDVDESQIIHALNDTANLDAGSKLLAQYGIFVGGDGGSSFAGLERQFTRLHVCSTLSLVFLVFCLGLL